MPIPCSSDDDFHKKIMIFEIREKKNACVVLCDFEWQNRRLLICHVLMSVKMLKAVGLEPSRSAAALGTVFFVSAS